MPWSKLIHDKIFMLISHPIHLLALVNIGLLRQYIPPTAKSYNSPDIPTSDSGQRTTYTSEYIVEHHFHNEINGVCQWTFQCH